MCIRDRGEGARQEFAIRCSTSLARERVGPPSGNCQLLTANSSAHCKKTSALHLHGTEPPAVFLRRICALSFLAHARLADHRQTPWNSSEHIMKPSCSSFLQFATIVGSLTILAGCTSAPQREAQWIDPGIATQSGFLRGEKILVACDAYDPALRRICQDRLYRDVLAKGANPVIAPAETILLNDRELDGQLVPAAAAAGAKAIFIMSLTPATTSAGSGASLGIGGFSFGGGGGASVGLGIPIGSGRVETGFAANGRVTDVRSKRLIWTATIVAAPSADLESQCDSLSRTMLDSAQAAGLF